MGLGSSATQTMASTTKLQGSQESLKKNLEAQISDNVALHTKVNRLEVELKKEQEALAKSKAPPS